MNNDVRQILLLFATVFVVALVLVLVFTCDAQALDRYGLRVRAEYALGQDTTATTKYYQEGMLNEWINDGVNYVSELTLCVEKETTLVIVASTTDYDMPSDFIRALGVIFAKKGAAVDLDVSPRGLRRTVGPLVGKEALDRAAGPLTYEDIGKTEKKLRFTPSPIASDSAFVRYAAYGDALDYDTSTCNLPRAYQLLIPDYAAWKAFAKTRIEPNPYKAMFLENLQILGLEPMARPPEQPSPSESTQVP